MQASTQSPSPALAACLRSHGTDSSNGFTLIEVMVVVAIVAILAAVASPSFAKIIDRYRVRQAADDLLATLYLARAEGIKRGGAVVIQKGACPAAQSAGRWDCGWTIFHDANGNLAPDADEIVQTSLPPAGTTIENRFPGNATTLRVDAWGVIGGTAGAGSFVLKPATSRSTDSTNAVTLCIGTGGRIRTVRETASCS